MQRPAFRKNPPARRSTPSRQIFESPSTEIVQPTHTKTQSFIAGGAGSESQECQRFLVKIVLISIL